jgi:peptidoglycan/xylan/chitin deacetylase (PgdA/CDA1 family)
MRSFVAGIGVILTLHRVRPPRFDRFQPNRLRPSFLDDVVRWLRRRGIDLVSLDGMHRRPTEQDFRRRFVCITIDDGYRDTLRFAYRILKKHHAPFAVYIPTSFPDRLGELWCLALEALVARSKRVQRRRNGLMERLSSGQCRVAGRQTREDRGHERGRIRKALIAACIANG